ncbi:MAG: hypothetical protein HYS27_01380 [Deltaproteobacteria bacterium]|nr:hypothetical protein [Deltaproteobacteria bacterium]
MTLFGPSDDVDAAQQASLSAFDPDRAIGAAGIARTFRRLRVVMSLLVALLIGRQVHSAWQALGDTYRAHAAEGTAGRVADLVVLSGRERGLFSLAAVQPQDDQGAVAAEQLRADIDRSLARTLGDARAVAATTGRLALGRAIDEVEASRGRVATARAAVTSAPSGEARTAAARQFIDAKTSFNEGLLALHAELLGAESPLSTPLRDLARVREATIEAAEHAGQERAIIAVELAPRRARRA